MSRDIASTTWHHSRAAERAWTMSFGTKQSWLSSCMMFMLQMKRAMISKLGLFIVKAEDCQKCDIYATPTTSTYSGDLTPQCKKIYNSRNRGGNGKFYTKCMYLLNNHSTKAKNIMVDHGRVGQFFPVFHTWRARQILVYFFGVVDPILHYSRA
jgi:hypothetical protein